ncbi:methylisocitrate lyase [Georgenia halophila]|uniref:Methylisocitrate lyase n=1 Tax=Georgenia halophila TaxID=620889 RepID=A0ABP8LKJ8_9MICO
MLYSHRSPARKRETFRERLDSGSLLRFAGAFNPLSAKVIEEKGLEGVYVSGAAVSAELGHPDIGLTTASELAARSQEISRMIELPTLVDADTGFGEPMNVARTVQLLEDAGVAGLHIEDQVNPKRCGHLDGKEVVDDATAAKRIRAAVDARRDPNLVVMARTDIRMADGLPATVRRAQLLVDAGADAVFPEALRDAGEFEAIRRAVDVPVLANMTEFGKSPLLTTRQLADIGINLVIYPVSLLRVAMGAVERALDVLTVQGTLESITDEMQHRARLYELVDYEAYNSFDSSIYTYRPGRGQDD